MNLYQQIADAFGKSIAREQDSTINWAFGDKICCGILYKKRGWFFRHRRKKH